MTTYDTLITVQELAALGADAGVLLVDCRHELADPGKGERAWTEGHLPGAVHAHLDRDLSDLRKPALGRHPLPDAADFAALLSRWGCDAARQVVVYDDAGGAIAARLWWMLRLAGHTAAAVLDGGFPAWLAAGLPVTREPPLPAACAVELAFQAKNLIDADTLQRELAADAVLLLDARAAPRFRGEVEPIDPVAGHVPGARNRPFALNLDARGCFKPRDALRAEFAGLLGARAAAQVVHMCGSGVTACHNLLAMEHAGLAGSRVYAPSWSGWIADPARPVARGDA